MDDDLPDDEGAELECEVCGRALSREEATEFDGSFLCVRHRQDVFEEKEFESGRSGR